MVVSTGSTAKRLVVLATDSGGGNRRWGGAGGEGAIVDRGPAVDNGEKLLRKLCRVA